MPSNKYSPQYILQIMEYVYANGPVTYNNTCIALPHIQENTIASELFYLAEKGDIDKFLDSIDQVLLFDMPDPVTDSMRIIRAAYRRSIYAEKYMGDKAKKFDIIAKHIGFMAAHRLCSSIVDGALLRSLIEGSLSARTEREEGLIIRTIIDTNNVKEQPDVSK